MKKFKFVINVLNSLMESDTSYRTHTESSDKCLKIDALKDWLKIIYPSELS